MILNCNSGGIDDFSVIITQFKYKNQDKPFNKFFQVPARKRMKDDGSNWWNLYIPGGYKIYIKVDQRKLDSSLRPVALSNENPIYVLNFEKFENTSEFKMLLDNVSRIKKKNNY